MRIALLGGTGDIGEGLALRFACDTDHEVVIGSRTAEKAETAAADYETRLDERGCSAAIESGENAAVVPGADVVVLSIPPYHVKETVETLADDLVQDQVLVTPAVGMKGDEDGLHYHPPSIGSVTELVADTAPERTPVVGAFHNLSAERLANLDADLDLDTLVVADDEAAKATVVELCAPVDGLRALDAGPLVNAPEVESVTPLLINVARYNEALVDVGVKYQ